MTDANGPPDLPPDPRDTQRYLDLIRSVHDEWRTLEASGDPSVRLSASALATVKESVRADARNGAHVAMPSTPAGPWTLTEAALRTLVRRAVDTVPGVRALRTTAEHAPVPDGARRTRGVPVRLRCRISVPTGAGDVRRLAELVRTAVLTTCHDHLRIPDLIVDIHIEDIHEHR